MISSQKKTVTNVVCCVYRTNYRATVQYCIYMHHGMHVLLQLTEPLDCVANSKILPLPAPGEPTKIFELRRLVTRTGARLLFNHPCL